jgi:hypothetical protein
VTAYRRHADAARQRGAALVVTLILVTALLAGGALAMYLQLADTRSTQYVTESRGALFCAEAGLAGARAYVTDHSSQWALMLDDDPDNDPVGYPVEGDLDDDGVIDWRVEIRDNDDEQHPAANDPTNDVDQTIFMLSTCVRFPDTPRQVLELISLAGGGHNYRDQACQGAGCTGNAN